MTPEAQAELKHYLIRPLDQSTAAIEENLIIDEELFEELLIVEDEMIDEYLSWEPYLLTAPDRNWQLQFARIFNEYVSTKGMRNAQSSKT